MTSATANPDNKSLPNWVLNLKFFKNKKPEVTRASLEGFLVLAADAPSDLELKLFLDDQELPIVWGAPSPNVPPRFRSGRNWTNARFLATQLPALAGMLELRLLDPASGTQSVVGTLAHIPIRGPMINLADIRARIADLAKITPREAHQHTELVSALASIPAEQRDTPWLEASLLSDALFLKNAMQGHQSLTQIQKRHQAAGSRDALDAFMREFQAIIHPRTLTSHGYTTPLSALHAPAVWKDIQKLIQKIEGIGYECFINSGTLLGVVREGALIAHDDDVDLAVIMHSSDLADIAKEWLKLKAALSKAGILDWSFEAQRSNHCKVGRAGGASVDLFAAWLVNDRVYIWPHTCGEARRDALLPLVEREVSGAVVKTPRVPEVFLECNYGKGWRIPDPSFHFDWARAFVRFSDFCAAMKLARETK